MKSVVFDVVIEREEGPEESYSAYCPSLPCYSNGRTAAEAGRNLGEAIQSHVAALLAHGTVVPDSSTGGHRIRLEQFTFIVAT